MRANERKGAWALLVLIIITGIFLWIIGKCESNEPKDSDNDIKIEYLDNGPVKLNESGSDRSIEGDSNIPSSKKRSEEKKTTRRKRSSKESSRASRKSKSTRSPMRDLLSDTVPN